MIRADETMMMMMMMMMVTEYSVKKGKHKNQTTIILVL